MTISGRERDIRLSPTEDMHLALTSMTSYQGTIHHADSKAAILVAGLAVLATADHPDIPLPLVSWLFTAGFLCGLIGSLWHLAIAVRPRTAGPAGDNRFALSNGASGAGEYDVRRLRDQAWQAAANLAGIAMQKHRRIERCMPWAGLSVFVFIVRQVTATSM